MSVSLQASPLLPWLGFALVVGLALLVAGVGIFVGARGAWLRALALGLFCLALLNPSLSWEDRETVPNVVVVVTDRSDSQSLAGRKQQTDSARAALEARLQGLKNTDIRFVEAGQGEKDGTQLFGALASALADVPTERVGGAVFLTDGQVHDIPAKAAALGFDAPLHALITGQDNERDRQITLVEAPRFGIVGKSQTVRFLVTDHGVTSGAPLSVSVKRDGEVIQQNLKAIPGQPTAVDIPIAHGGQNIVEIEVDRLPGELTEVNNRAVLLIDGVRDKLRVLLVSGEPHAGERTWRNLLKADANVDLVHFTILRPPEKQDNTPTRELSLIAFPTRTLFVEKIDDFDLIIFDRYAQEGILPPIYFENIAEYVRKGGAVLVASGPDYASVNSLWGTPLADVLPAEPTGGVIEEPFRPRLTDLGRRHPVTRRLPGSQAEPPQWGEWFRVVETRQTSGVPVMSGAQSQPLLILARQDKGRVGLLLSDHAWLWARGYGGGGPHVDLLRRLSHWLMKESDLEEEALRALPSGQELVVERQTMADTAAPVTATAPDGTTAPLTLTQTEPGLWRGTLSAAKLGLWRVTDGTLTTLANVGPANPREYQNVVSTTQMLEPIASQSKGSVRRIEIANQLTLPRVMQVRAGSAYAGADWIGFKQASASVVRGVGSWPLFAGLLGMALLIGILALTWALGRPILGPDQLFRSTHVAKAAR